MTEEVENAFCYVVDGDEDRKTTVYIDFPMLLGNLVNIDEDVEEDICSFSLRRKTNYVKLADIIVEVADIVFSGSPTLALSYLKMKMKILGLLDPQSGSFYGEKEFCNDMVTFAKNPAVVRAIETYIDEEYGKLEALKTNTGTTNNELQFTDDHAKTLLKGSYTIKLIIPLITEYMYQNSMKQVKSLFLDTYLQIINAYGGDDYNLCNKLYKLTESRVRSTAYSDSVMWNYLENMGNTAHTKIQQYFKTLIIDIVPKLDVKQGTIGYLHSALVHQLNYTFRTNFDLTYNPTSPSYKDSDDSNPFETLETPYQHDEGEEIMKELEIQRLLNKEREVNGEFEESELDFYCNHIEYHTSQIMLVTLWYSRYARGNYDLFSKCSHRQFVELLLHLFITLEKNGYEHLANVLLTKSASSSRKRHLPSKTFVTEVLKTERYNELVGRFFSSIKERFERKNLLFAFIEVMFQDRFFIIPDPEEATSVELTTEEMEPFEVDIRQLGLEAVLMFESLGRG